MALAISVVEAVGVGMRIRSGADGAGHDGEAAHFTGAGRAHDRRVTGDR
jgi:hypothetical protein